MIQEDSFLWAISENPDDDAPRLAFAVWLQEHGDPRGEFIRVQCELAKIGKDAPSAPGRQDLESRQRAW
jgi:uncharacterized protein (TIGR02996 family)